MMNPRRHAILSLKIALLLASAAVARTPGVQWSAGAAAAEAAAVSDSIFRISVNANGPAAQMESIYLDPARAPEIGGAVADDGDTKSIKTAAGELRIDTKGGRYMLADATGKTIIPWALLVAPQQKAGSLAVGLGWPADRPFAVYGSGNPNGSLVQKSVKAHVGNGVAVQPFFWSPAAFAVFVVGDNANAPAACDGRVADGAVTITSKGSAADLYLMLAPTLGDATRGLLSLTGRPPVPPMWAFGYLQSRWGWEDAAYIDDVIAHFKDHHLPVDAFIFDFEWYTKFPDYGVKPDGLKDFPDFKIQPALFPDSAAPFKKVKDAGLKFIGIRKPRLGDRDSLNLIRSNGWGLRPVDGAMMDQRAMDFSNANMRQWYADHTVPLLKDGVDGWWNDEGEFTYTTYPYWVQAEREALDKVSPGQRLWTINRAFCPGLSRFGAAAWTGDIHPNWAALRRAPADLLNWSVAGMPYGSTDIGGFAGETNPELLTRWMEAGTFFPNMRTHSTIMTKPHFPWLFGDESEAAMKKALQLRYRLVPYFYGLAHVCHETGTPLMRPLVMAFPNDPAAAEINDQWLVGDGLMAAPVLVPGGKRQVYLPAGTWYDFATGEKIDGGRTLDVTAAYDQVPAYVRAGTVLPLATVAERTADLAKGPLEIRVYAGHDASFTIAEDDGQSEAYAKGTVRKTTFTWNDAAGELSWKRSGTFEGTTYATFKVTVIGEKPWQSAERPLSEAGSLKAGG
ncbi:MAG: yicI 2 [Phycisphaerales bacterium]|nr:yicI 2 [Phycisphaerales bacterium]